MKKYKKVKFSNGKYGIRKGYFPPYRFVHIRRTYESYRPGHEYLEACIGTEEQADEVLALVDIKYVVCRVDQPEVKSGIGDLSITVLSAIKNAYNEGWTDRDAYNHEADIDIDKDYIESYANRMCVKIKEISYLNPQIEDVLIDTIRKVNLWGERGV